MSNRLDLACVACGFEGLDDGSDGFFYCQRCGTQNDEIRDTAIVNEDVLEGMEAMGVVRRRVPVVVKAEPISQVQPRSQFWENLRTQEENNGVGPTEPHDFGTDQVSLRYEDYYSEIRLRYVMGVQTMIQLQIKALIENFNVSPLVVGMVEPIWLRFVASMRLFADGWADEVIQESESQAQEEADGSQPRFKYRAEPHNLRGKRSIMIWYRSISKAIPLSYSLVISFLVCHLAREAILPTDIVKWTLEGKLPYFAAFLELEKQIGPPSNACPLTSSRMFRPTHPVSSQMLESLAAYIADMVGLELPPVNFYAIASRYLRDLSLPVRHILPHAIRIFEWCMPPELWLSANEFRLPTRAFVMSILIVSIRILYDINGFGKWEGALSNGFSAGKKNNCVEPVRQYDTNPHPHGNDDSVAASSRWSGNCQSELDATELLLSLEAKYRELMDKKEYAEDLPTYLQYCKDVIFAGMELPFDDREEEIIDDLWDYYLKKEDPIPSEVDTAGSVSPSHGCHKRPRYDSARKPKEDKNFSDIGYISDTPGDKNFSDSGYISDTPGDKNCSDSGYISDTPGDFSQDNRKQNGINTDYQSQDSVQSHKERAIKRMISNMEENKFCYIPPRVNVKKHGYLQYTRKKDEGFYTYAAHADYYILLRCFAKVAQLDVRAMHTAVLSFERRLAFLEKNIDHYLKMNPMYDVCEFCSDEAEQNVTKDATMDFSNLNL